MEKLPAELQQKFGYDSGKAKAYRNEEQNQTAAMQIQAKEKKQTQELIANSFEWRAKVSQPVRGGLLLEAWPYTGDDLSVTGPVRLGDSSGGVGVFGREPVSSMMPARSDPTDRQNRIREYCETHGMEGHPPRPAHINIFLDGHPHASTLAVGNKLKFKAYRAGNQELEIAISGATQTFERWIWSGEIME